MYCWPGTRLRFYPKKTLFLAMTGLSYLNVPNSTSKMLRLMVLTVFTFFALFEGGFEKLKNGTKRKAKMNSLWVLFLTITQLIVNFCDLNFENAVAVIDFIPSPDFLKTDNSIYVPF
jgi:hypothetical protein